MKKILLGTIGAVAVLALGFVIVGATSAKSFEGKLVAEYDFPKDKVWKTLTDLNDMPNRRKEITVVEVLEKDEAGNPKKWKEITDMGGFIIFEAAKWDVGKELRLKMAESTFGMSGEWSFFLEEISASKTKVTIEEKSTIDSLSVRAIMTLAGRDSNLQLEKENLKNALGQSK